MPSSAAPPTHVSVVIPALNEADRIHEALASVARQSGAWEAIVAVGDSEDGTGLAARRALADVLVVSGDRGRARQMNDGAATASGDCLLFLHADTCLPPTALDAVRGALADPTVVGGCFRTAFDLDESLSGFGRAVMRAWSAPLWMRWHRFAFGDRGLFVRREAFEAIGGFPDQPIMEDLDAVRSLRELGRFVFLDASVTTSARRFARHGVVWQQLRNGAIWLGWLAGVRPARLKRFYSDQDRG